MKRVKRVGLLGCVPGEACSLSVLRTIRGDFTVCSVTHSAEFVLKTFGGVTVHFPVRSPKTVFFHHGTSQYDFVLNSTF